MPQTSRRAFLKTSACSGLLFLIRPEGLGRITDDAFLSDIGVCGSLEDHKLFEVAGCTYIEDGVGRLLVPEEAEDKFQSGLAVLKISELPVRACNGFLPGKLKAVGPEARHEEILAYAGTAFRRATQAGVRTIVWGSGESRKIPEGFPRDKAGEQFAHLARKTAELASRSDVILALEPLNRGETNFLNNLKEGAAMVEAVGRPNFKLLADLYHIRKEGESPAALEACGKYIHHCHIAEVEKRTPPGTAGDDFRPFLRALKNIRYAGGISFECRWDDRARQLPAAVAFLKKQISEVVPS
jgi:sugar phosphate isomerase/epimerase